MSITFNPFTGNLDFVGTGGGGGSITGGGTATEVAFFTAATAIGSDAGLFYLPVSGGGPRLGLGTQTPTSALHIAGNALVAGAAEAANDAAAQTARFVMLRSRGTLALPTPAQSGTILGQLLWAGYDGGTPGIYPSTTASIQCLADETFGAAAYGGHLRFFTTTIGTVGSAERMRLADDGSLLIGTTSKIAGSRVLITGGALHVLAGNALRLQGAGAGFSSFVDPSHAANLLYTLPANQGPAGTMLTNVDGAGTLDWRPAPAGLPGEDGIDGEPGPPGVTGATGPQGATGNTGNTGATGAPGLHGMDGIDGDDGMAFPIPGVQGPQGIQGIQGIQGVQGLQGFMGIPGGDGLDGEEGMPMPGIPGPQGPTGALGPQGVQGPPGLSDDGGGGADEWPSFFGQPTLTGDPFNMYTRLAGRIGTTNDTILSTSGVGGTFSGSNQPGGLLTLQGSTSLVVSGPNPFPTVRIGSNIVNSGSQLNSFLAFDAALNINGGGSLFAVEVGSLRGVSSTWNAAATVGANFLFALQPLILASLNAPRQMGDWTILLNAPSFVSNGANCTVGSVTALQDTWGTSTASQGAITCPSSASVISKPALSAGDQITNRLGFQFGNPGLSGARQPTAVALQVDEQTSTSTPSIASLTVLGTIGTTTWGYRVTATSAAGETLASIERTTSIGAAVLTATDRITVSWSATPGATGYNIYRTTAGGTPNTTGKIGSTAGTNFTDTGLAATTAVPGSDTSLLSGFVLGAAVRSAITDAGDSSKMFLQDTGGARSEFAGMFTRYKNVPTKGWGIPGINGYNRTVGATGGVASVATFTVGAADGTFSVSGNVLVTTSISHSFSVQVDYTDEGGTARTATLNVQQLGGSLVTVITNLTGAGPYEGLPLHLRAKAATAITVKTTGTFTTVTYNVEGAIVQIA